MTPFGALSRRDLFLLLAVVGGTPLAAEFLAACVPPPTVSTSSGTTLATSVPVRVAEKMTFGMSILPPTLDPMTVVLGCDQTEFFSVIFDSLVRMENDKLAPGLALSWRTLDNNVTWEFKLRPNVTFSNGEPFDSSTVVGNFQRGTPPRVMQSYTRIGPAVDRMEAIAPLTVRVVTKTPDGLLPGRIVDGLVLPMKYLQQVGDDEFGRKPIGTGPYKVTAWRPNDGLDVEANPASWRGAPRTRSWTFQVMPEASTRLNALRTGTADVVSGIAIDTMRQGTTADFKLIPVDEAAIVSALFSPLQDTPFKDIRVRQAARYDINKKLLIDTYFRGIQKSAGAQFVPSVTVGHDPNLKDLEFDLEMSRKLLADAGYANGFDIKLSANSGTRFVQDAATFVADQLRQVGIRAEIEILEASIYSQRFLANQLGPLQVITSVTSPLLDADLTLQFWTSQSVPNRMAVPDFDDTLIKARGESDTAKRVAMLQRCVQILAEQSVVAPLYQEANIWGISPKLNDFKKNVSTGMNLEGMTKSL